MTHHIYVIQNTVNNKIYIGQTNNIRVREKAHKRNALKYKSPLYNSMKSHGTDKFKMFSILECNTPEETDIMERHYIALYQTQNRAFGYNISAGGRVSEMHNYHSNNRNSSAKLTEEEVTEIRKLFLSKMTPIAVLARTYKLNERSISDIIRNKGYQSKSYIPPTEEEIQKIFNVHLMKNCKKIKDETGNIFNSVRESAAYFKVSHNTITYRIKNPNSKLPLPKMEWIT